MKNRQKSLKKQGIRTFLITTSLMFIFGLVVFGVYSYITLNDEIQMQQHKTNERFYEFTERINSYYDAYSNSFSIYSNTLAYTIQSFSDFDTKIVYYRDAIPSSANNNSSTYESHNALPFEFCSSNENIYCTIDYEQLRKSITDEDYNEICEYINIEPDTENNNEKYILSCTEAYRDDNYYEKNTDLINFYPAKLQILKIDDNTDWYVQAEIIKEYTLDNNIVNSENIILYSIGDMNMNEIDKDFFEGNYYECNITDENIDEVSNHSDEGELYDLGGFNYVLHNTYTKNYEMKISLSESEIKHDEFHFYHKINLLEICKNELLTMLIYILISFTAMGVLIAFMSWNNLKKQMKLEEKRRELTNSMAHDLKTPLFVIGGYAENLIENVHTDKKDHYAQMIYDKTQEMNRLVHNMLDLSKLESNSFIPHMEEFDLVNATKDILVQFRTAKEFNISLEGIDEVSINADKDLIKRAISNLVQNVEKYSEDGKAVITISSNEFSISNTCTKIKSNEIKKLWDPYYMGNNSVRNNGNGLGLSIVKNIMQAHKFEFGARLENKTIVFYFRFF